MSEKELIEKDLDEAAQQQEEEQIRNLERYHYLKHNGFILFETITGSQAHGTNTESSDIDKAFVYILPEEDILGIRYKEQLKIHKDFMGYEIRRFLELLRTGNPTILELVNSPEDCILIKHPSFDVLLENKNKFITRACENSFHGYAKQQRAKAEGLEKLQSWEGSRITKKTPIDFCNIPVRYGFRPMTSWLEENSLDQMFCGLAAVDHCRDLYAVYYDHEAHKSFSKLVSEQEREKYRQDKLDSGESMGFGYKGVAFEDSNDIRLSNIPKEERINGFLCHMSYNKDGYTKHCKDFKRYQEWLVNRNESRWVEIKGHGQQIDGKNMMHFMRLILIGKEIAEGKGVNIRRPDAKDLLKIRRGEISLRELYDRSDSLLAEMKVLFHGSSLPKSISEDVIHDLLVNIRRKYYICRKQGYPIYNNESNNAFIQNRFGKHSELQFEMCVKIDERINDGYFSDYAEFLESNTHPWFDIIPLNRWPKTKNLKTGKMEYVNTADLKVIRLTRDKVRVCTGGDNQMPIIFDVVMWADIAIPINIKTSDGSEVIFHMDNKTFYKQLGING